MAVCDQTDNEYPPASSRAIMLIGMGTVGPPLMAGIFCAQSHRVRTASTTRIVNRAMRGVKPSR